MSYPLKTLHSSSFVAVWPRVLFPALLFSLLLFALLSSLQYHQPTARLVLPNARIHPLDGFSYAYILPKPFGYPLLSYAGDDYEIERSRLQLLENGVAFGEPHTDQQLITAQGKGRFLHLRARELYLSTPDNSDPRTNGREYVARVPVVPSRGVLAGFAIFIASCLAACLRSSPAPLFAPMASALKAWSAWIPPILFLLLTLGWILAIWRPAPLLIDSGDGGNVASMIAGWLKRERFAGDLVFATDAASRFYMVVFVPVIMALFQLTKDVGQAYILLMVPLLLLHLFGFYLLGRRLFHSRFWALVLALVVIPPVYLFPGELWGLLPTPLTRATAGAALPFLLIFMLRRERPAWFPFAVMTACGVGVYLHSVSTASIAVGCWLVLLCDKPRDRTVTAHVAQTALAGVCFVVIALPFVYVFASGFPSGSNSVRSPEAALAAKLLNELVGPQYYDFRLMFSMMIKGDNNPAGSWGWAWLVWGLGALGSFLVPRNPSPAVAEDGWRLARIAMGLLVGSVGIVIADQLVAALLGRRPVQIDLVRNVRFVVPLLQLYCVWLLAIIDQHMQKTPRQSGIVVALGTAFCLLWWGTYPTPLTKSLSQFVDSGKPIRQKHAVNDARIVAGIGRLSPGSRILLLPNSSGEGAVELVGMAIRYGAFQPVVHLSKDLNLLAYSGSGKVSRWLEAENRIKALTTLQGPAVANELSALVRDFQANYVLLYVPAASPDLVAGLQAVGDTVTMDGPWQLQRVTPTGQPSR